MSTQKIKDLILVALIIYLIFLNVSHCSRQTEKIDVIKVDTILQVSRDTLIRTDTIIKYKLVPSRTTYIHDTIIMVDTVSVKVPVVKVQYEDSTYKAEVEGGGYARLNSIAVYPQRTWITEQQTVRMAVKPKISLVAGVGVGYDVCHQKCSPIVGVMIGVPVWGYYGKRKN